MTREYVSKVIFVLFLALNCKITQRMQIIMGKVIASLLVFLSGYCRFLTFMDEVGLDKDIFILF